MTKIVRQVNTSPKFHLLHCAVIQLWTHDLMKVNKTSYHTWILNATTTKLLILQSCNPTSDSQGDVQSASVLWSSVHAQFLQLF